MSEINVVPYIDVMLVLLVIFMITAPLIYHGVDLDLPQVSSEPIEEEQEEPLVVSLDAEGQTYLNKADDPDEPLERHELIEVITALMVESPGRRVLLRGDQHVSYGEVVALMADLRDANVQSVGLMSEPNSGADPGAGSD
ncbi:protein TolR [Halorhodospira halochloris]|nr:protein TolR [Halorhodospira halochloris]MBK1652287.1 protein TolR [Halorhodospira halochloris]MCG5531593.1 protein TolR [Halorhodospira halochloris]MCG5548360.1 protein TolR [Halorhodospira halochloris]